MSRILDRIAPPRMGTGYRWLLASSWVTNIGDGIALSAGPLLVASQTHNAILVALAETWGVDRAPLVRLRGLGNHPRPRAASARPHRHAQPDEAEAFGPEPTQQ